MNVSADLPVLTLAAAQGCRGRRTNQNRLNTFINYLLFQLNDPSNETEKRYFSPQRSRANEERAGGGHERLCKPIESNCGNKKSVQVGSEAEEKRRGGQTAMKSLMLAASVEIGSANCPKSRASPHSSRAGGDAAKASPNVKWHLLNTRRGGCVGVSPVVRVVQVRSASLSPRLSRVSGCC